MSGGKRHYAWKVLAGCCLLNCGVSGLINAVGLFYAPVSEALGLTIAQVSSARTVQSLTASVFLLLFAGRLMEKNYRATLLWASLVHGAGWISMAMCRAMWQFYLVSAVTGMTLAILQSLAVSVTLSAWFREKRGFAFSVAAAASGIGGIFISWATGEILWRWGWRVGYLFFGVLALTLTLCATFFLLRQSPEACGMEPYGEKTVLETPAPHPNNGGFRGRIWTCPVLYGILFLYAVFNFCTTATVHTSNYAISVGFDLRLSAYVTSVGLTGNTVGKLLVGILRDKFGTLRAAMMSVSAVFVGFMLLIFSPDTMRLYLGVFLVGSAMALPTVIGPVLTADYFSGRDYTKVLPIAATAGSLVGACGNWIFGLSFDMTGGYTWIFGLCSVLMAAAFTMLTVLKHSRRPHPMKRSDEI